MRKLLSLTLIALILSVASYAQITGTTHVCVGATTTLTGAPPGGIWGSLNTGVATVGATSGVVTGVAPGVDTITYIDSGHFYTTLVTVNPLPMPIGGPSSVCVGSTITLRDSTSGGFWTSSTPTVGTISTGGVVTGISAGVTTITYTTPGTYCFTTKTITVNPLPAPISGPGVVLTGGNITLTDATPGGTWSSSNTAIATINSSTGLVTGVSAGICHMTYMMPGGCFVTTYVTDSGTTYISPITGASAVCVGSTITLSDTTSGGTWSSSNTSIATVGATTGVVTGVSAGSVTITYTVGTHYVTTTITVSSAASISGPSAVCVGSTITLTGSPTGGTWSSGNTLIATVTTAGVVTGVGPGIVNIYYLSGGCYAYHTVTVSAVPAAITGTTTCSVGGTSTLSDVTSGGTWSSSTPSIATVNPSSGLVTGVSAGTCAITYSIGGCYVRVYFTVTGGTSISPISGPTSVCVGSTITLYDTTSGGTWSSSNTSIATVTSAGVVTGVSAGTVTITYTVGLSYVTRTITVNAAPAAIGGPTTTTVGGTVTLTDATTGGTWSSSTPSIATINPSTGLVTGVSAGTCAMTYTLTTGCWVRVYFTVTGGTTISPITGTTSLCVGSTTTLFDSTTGGTWSSSNTAIATINATSGLVTGISAGTVTFTYTVGLSYVTWSMTVHASPAAIGGPTTTTVGGVVTLTDATGGGTWSSSNPSIATVSPSTGVVAGMSVGTCAITYMLTTGCWARIYFTVTGDSTTIISPITGSTSLCVGSTTTLSDATPGGTWSSSNTAVATVTTTGGVVTGVSAGTVTITYTVGGSHVTWTMTVHAAATITGSSIVCVGSSTTLTASITGGSWFSSNTAVATVGLTSGVVTGVSAGTVTIYYNSGGCYSTHTMTVGTGATISGPSTVCAGSTITLTGSPSGGTWYSSNTAVATVGSTGIVTGVSAGTVNIYYSGGGCYAYHPVTVSAAATISGSSSMCIGSTTTLTASITGGRWSSGNTAVATVGSSTGVVTAVGSGVVNIYYLVGTCYSYHTVTVNAAASITGGSTVCVGSTMTLTASPSGGSWASSNTAVATVSTAGVVTGIGAGTANIYYSSGGCYAYHPVTVHAAATITGSSSICVGSTTTLTASITGGSWFSSNTAVATIGLTSGVVTGVSAGTVTIYYNSGGCYSSYTMTVNAAATITGSSTVCIGTTTALTASITGGTWSSSNTAVATVSTAGVVTGVSAGTVTIYYHVGSCYSYHTMTVNAMASITGGSTVCVGGTISLTASPSGGTWTSGNTAIATVSTAGVVTGIGAGIVNIYYNVGGCYAYHTVTVNAASATISGNTSLCVGTTTTLTGSPSGGTWTSSYTVSATVGSSTGVVTGVSAGTATIYYSVGGCYAYRTETVTPVPATISGPSTLCVGESITLTDATTGGTWSSSSTAVATVTSTGGVVTGVSAGVANIYYLMGGCGTYHLVTVNPTPAPITGSLSVLIGYAITLSDATPGGTWLSGNPSIATVNPMTGVVTGVSAGTVNIYYSEGPCGVYVTITVSEVPLDPVHGTTFVGSVNANTGSVKLYPNPTNGILNVQWDGQNSSSNNAVLVTDVTGREVFRSTLDINAVSGKAQFNFGDLKDGMYFINIKSDNINYTGKLQIIR